MSDRLPSTDTHDELHTYLGALFGREGDGGQVEVRYRKPDGPMRQRFYDPGALQRALPTLRVLARRHDVYLGVAPRTGRRGGLGAIGHCWALWIDCDGDTSLLHDFDHPPSMTVASGSGPGHEHAYWLLNQPLDPSRAAQLNRRLAHTLNGDPQSADAARILRPPGTSNHKHNPAAEVTMTSFTGETYDPDQLAGTLDDPAPAPGAIAPAAIRTGPRTDTASDPLLGILPPVYIGHLLGHKPDREGKVRCPFHSDSTPSLHVYSAPGRGWACFGCGRGGSIYDLAGELWGYSTRGREFLALRQRLTDELLPT